MLQRVIAKLEEDAGNEIHSILGMLELATEEPLSDSQYEHLCICKASADRLLRSVRSVCQFVCPESVKPELSEIDLRELVAETAGLMKELARRKGLNFKTEIRAGTPELITADRHRIENILVRLLDNSIRFTDQGWIELILATCATPSVPPRVDFVVSDSGPGIRDRTIARVMNSVPPDHPEDGLGLPIVHQLVLGMGGEISIVRSDGGGTRITVSLPFQTAEVSASPVPIGAEHGERQSRESVRPLNILIAEDSDQSYYVIESFLDGQGHRLTRAQNGANAVDRFKSGVYDLVLMDVHMPVMDGYTAARAIREWETTDGRARVPIVILSSDSLETQRANGAMAGCSGYLTKPASKAAVLSSLKRFAGTSVQD